MEIPRRDVSFDVSGRIFFFLPFKKMVSPRKSAGFDLDRGIEGCAAQDIHLTIGQDVGQ